MDWYYTAEALKAGGLVVVDDLQLVTARILADFLRADARWDEVYRDRRFAAYRKRVPSLRDDRDWLSQAWVVRSNPVAAVRVVRAGPLRRLLGMAAQALGRPRRGRAGAAPEAAPGLTRSGLPPGNGLLPARFSFILTPTLSPGAPRAGGRPPDPTDQPCSA